MVDSIAFRDHHRYTAEDMEQLTESLRGTRGRREFLTTEKDAVKFTAELRARLEAAGPVCVVGLQAVFVDPEAVVRELEARLQ